VVRPRGRGSFTPDNFKKDATVRPSHGRPHGHRPIVRPSVRPSVQKRPRDNPVTEGPEGLDIVDFIEKENFYLTLTTVLKKEEWCFYEESV
jgi:hypothetical protein